MSVEPWALDEVRTALVAASQRNDTVSVAQLREDVGIGHDDLMAVLDALRADGLAREEAPGDWTAGDGVTEPEPPAAREEAARAAMDRRDGRGEAPGRELVREGAESARPAPREDAGEVVLTMAVASALDAETIGKLVEAGIAEAKQAARAFVLRVDP